MAVNGGRNCAKCILISDSEFRKRSGQKREIALNPKTMLSVSGQRLEYRYPMKAFQCVKKKLLAHSRSLTVERRDYSDELKSRLAGETQSALSHMMADRQVDAAHSADELETYMAEAQVPYGLLLLGHTIPDTELSRIMAVAADSSILVYRLSEPIDPRQLIHELADRLPGEVVDKD